LDDRPPLAISPNEQEYNIMTPELWGAIQDKLLVALKMEPNERSIFLAQVGAADREMQQELASLIAAHEQADSEFLKAPKNPGLANASREVLGKRVGNYQIKEELGAGGMGEVYRAVRIDDQYRKEVAIKLVRAGQDSGFVLHRFKTERQILAGLEHPNITRLLDGGTTEDGLPYFVMELIEGQPIDRYCRNRELSIPERLRLFLQVCSAVAYAHQRLIIHRDIKPNNILVTSGGIPKLLDFGIAKILEVDNVTHELEPTLTVFRVLTPAYASPEQVRGEPITTASDIYSLGVVLYELLAGRHPYRRSDSTPQDLLRAVCEVEPERLSAAVRQTEGKSNGSESTPAAQAGLELGSGFRAKLSKSLQGDLDNIVAMALRKEPQRRYSSVERFAEDIRRHLENLPVLARRDTVVYRTAKFITRHRVSVAAGTAIILMLVAGLAITMREAGIADVQRKKAEQRFQDVRALANSMIFDVHDSIADLPGATPARKLIVEKALQYLDSLAAEAQGDPSLQRELAGAYKRIGDVQGYEFTANLGDTPAALKSYEKALAIRKALAAPNGNVSESLELAESFRLVSQTQLFANNLSVALENIQQAVGIMEPLAQTVPNDAHVLLELFADYQATANILGGGTLSNLGDNVAATSFRRKQLAAAEHLAGLDPEDASGQGNLAIATTAMGDQLWQSGEARAPLKYYSRARSMFLKLSAHSHKQARALYLLQLVDVRIALVEISTGSTAQALATARDAADIGRKLSLADPHNVQSSEALADDYVLLADLESRTGNTVAATSYLSQASPLIEHFVGLSPKDTENLALQAHLYVVAGDLANGSGNNRRALQSYEEAVAVLSRVQSENSRNVAARIQLAATYNEIGRTQLKLRDFEAALATFEQARTLANPEAVSAHDNAQALYTLADSYGGLGGAEAHLGSDVRKNPDHRVEHWRRAIYDDQQSFATRNLIKEPGMISPDGFDATPPAILTRQLAQANTALARLIAKPPIDGTRKH
jgi:eukaryotic-like serine/threonine-protein kinase